ncbi:hypothetical protein PS2_149 [Serratia phage PS2]|uniref:Uncharacterized protein n=1 Tax=Serratia phage PS2 TaxID=1481112 RepID=A0A023W555_9CAUD|nr:hypothetical protein FF83_gp266 [Serratia phage PS2]AHY25395.1 hypothetical protein PS2_149 [Serratia phage PS2]
MKNFISEFSDLKLSDDEYNAWKEKFVQLSESDKLLNVVGPISQWMLCPESHAAGSIVAVVMMCVNRYIEETSLEDF